MPSSLARDRTNFPTRRWLAAAGSWGGMLPGMTGTQKSAIMGGAWLIGLGLDERRFPRSGDEWSSPDFATATHRVEINVSGGVGSVRVS
jgi:hypothetical protein